MTWIPSTSSFRQAQCTAGRRLLIAPWLLRDLVPRQTGLLTGPSAAALHSKTKGKAFKAGPDIGQLPGKGCFSLLASIEPLFTVKTVNVN